jgi:hypothetical protein
VAKLLAAFRAYIVGICENTNSAAVHVRWFKLLVEFASNVAAANASAGGGDLDLADLLLTKHTTPFLEACRGVSQDKFRLAASLLKKLKAMYAATREKTITDSTLAQLARSSVKQQRQATKQQRRDRNNALRGDKQEEQLSYADVRGRVLATIHAITQELKAPMKKVLAGRGRVMKSEQRRLLAGLVPAALVVTKPAR